MAKIDVFTLVEATPDLTRHDSATIVELKDGRLLLAWMEHVGGKTLGHDHSPCNIASMVSSDGGRSWGEHRILVENNPGDVNIHFPCFLRLRSGDILFYYQRRHELHPGAPQVSTSYVCKSSDEGQTFSPPREHGVIRRNDMSGNVLTQLSTGRIILSIGRTLGDWCGRAKDGTGGDHCVSGCSYSDDDGHTWTASDTWVGLPLRGCMEPHVAELRDGRILMTLRTDLGSVFQSESTNGGVTWSKPQTTGLRAPESMPCLVRIPKTGDLLIIWNHSQYDPTWSSHYGKRTPLTVALSKDDGRTWEKIKDIETDPTYEFTNPSCHFTSQDKVIITYVASKMDKPDHPGRFGRSCMPLKAALADLEWFYE